MSDNRDDLSADLAAQSEMQDESLLHGSNSPDEISLLRSPAAQVDASEPSSAPSRPPLSLPPGGHRDGQRPGQRRLPSRLQRQDPQVPHNDTAHDDRPAPAHAPAHAPALAQAAMMKMMQSVVATMMHPMTDMMSSLMAQMDSLEARVGHESQSRPLEGLTPPPSFTTGLMTTPLRAADIAVVSELGPVHSPSVDNGRESVTSTQSGRSADSRLLQPGAVLSSNGTHGADTQPLSPAVAGARPFSPETAGHHSGLRTTTPRAAAISADTLGPDHPPSVNDGREPVTSTQRGRSADSRPLQSGAVLSSNGIRGADTQLFSPATAGTDFGQRQGHSSVPATNPLLGAVLSSDSTHGVVTLPLSPAVAGTQQFSLAIAGTDLGQRRGHNNVPATKPHVGATPADASTMGPEHSPPVHARGGLSTSTLYAGRNAGPRPIQSGAVLSCDSTHGTDNDFGQRRMHARREAQRPPPSVAHAHQLGLAHLMGPNPTSPVGRGPQFHSHPASRAERPNARYSEMPSNPFLPRAGRLRQGFVQDRTVSGYGRHLRE